MLLALLLVIIIVFISVYLMGKNNENYWKKRGVIFHKKNKVMGLYWDLLRKEKSVFENLHDIYKEYPNDPAVGIGSLFTPMLYIRHPLNIQHVMLTDFNSFDHRGLDPNKDDLLADNILFLNGTKWKLIRKSLSPLFTSRKLKNMFYIMEKCSQDFIHYINKNPELLKFDTYETLSTFCSAAMTTAVFGLTTDSIFDSHILQLTKESGDSGFMREIKFAISHLSESVFKILNFKLFKEYENLIVDTFKKAMQQRRLENANKYDFAAVCISIQNGGKLKDSESRLEIEPTDELLAAQAFLFFVAGVQPTASGIFYTLFELGKHPLVLDRLHKEIDAIFQKYEGILSYDIVANMEYLDMVMCEAMRINPPIGHIPRKCTEATVLPVGNIKIDKGTNIMIPIYELHHDPTYHSDPEKFDPERFSREKRQFMSRITYMPFGMGNKKCLGMRYGLMQAKSCLIHLLHNFSVKTILPESGIKYRKEHFQIRMTNVDIELIPRV